jgi:hypothetical protein
MPQSESSDGMARFIISLKNGSRYKLNHLKWRWLNFKPLGFHKYFANFGLIRNGTMMRSPDLESAQINGTGDTYIIHFGQDVIYDEINQYIIIYVKEMLIGIYSFNWTIYISQFGSDLCCLKWSAYVIIH